MVGFCKDSLNFKLLGKLSVYILTPNTNTVIRAALMFRRRLDKNRNSDC